mmetsp:Transcript_1209/g.4791  ORF Transcript_1209/g.4791 Transcript_1209/m.4791 type:complete len:272 (-) Transcript_1209:2861-3676(-)
MGSSTGRGGRPITPLSRGLKMRAVAGRLSVTRLTNSSCTGSKKLGKPSAPMKKSAATSPMLLDTRYRMTLLTLALIARPSPIALTMVAKLSSARTMSDASLATSVPVMPIARPTSASLSAGASFTPSPVMATTLPLLFSRRTMSCLCFGSARLKTRPPPPLRNSSWSASDIVAKDRAVMLLVSSRPSPSSKTPMSRQMASAVRLLSPVMTMTRTPASRQDSMLARTSGRGGSRRPARPTRVRSDSTSAYRVGSASCAKTSSPSVSSRVLPS